MIGVAPLWCGCFVRIAPCDLVKRAQRADHDQYARASDHSPLNGRSQQCRSAGSIIACYRSAPERVTGGVMKQARRGGAEGGKRGRKRKSPPAIKIPGSDPATVMRIGHTFAVSLDHVMSDQGVSGLDVLAAISNAFLASADHAIMQKRDEEEDPSQPYVYKFIYIHVLEEMIDEILRWDVPTAPTKDTK
jgi:hypothetical protein